MQIQQTGISFKSEPPGPEPRPDSFREGISDTGPNLNQPLLRKEIITGDMAICPTKAPSSSAVAREMVSWSLARKAFMIKDSVPLLWAAEANAAFAT